MDDRIRAMMWAALGGRAGNDPTEHFAMAAKQAIEEVTGATMPRYSGSAADYLRMLGVEIDANNTRFRALVNLMMRWRQDATRPAQPDASRRFSLETHRAAAILDLKQAYAICFFGPCARAGGRAARIGRRGAEAAVRSFGQSSNLLSWLGATADRNDRVPVSVKRAERRPYDAAARRVISNATGERAAQLIERTRVASGSRPTVGA